MKDCASTKDLSDCKENCNELRHKLRDEVQGHYFWIDNKVEKNSLDNNSLKVQMTNIQREVWEIKQDMKEWFWEMKSLINGLKNEFVTKTEFNNTKWTLKSLVIAVVTVSIAIVWTWATLIWELLTKQIT